jgi:hypothetical protein
MPDGTLVSWWNTTWKAMDYTRPKHAPTLSDPAQRYQC